MHKLLFALFVLISIPLAASEPVSTDYRGSAIAGMDTVAYHDANVQRAHKAIMGTPTYTVKWMNANWQFASRSSADKFAANPEHYRPEYNGHCSNALSLDEGLIPTNGQVWEFFGNKLHLFYAERGRQRWLTGDWQTYLQQADRAWQTLSQ